MLAAAKSVAATTDFTGEDASSREVPYLPRIKVGGNAASGPSFVDNDGYRKHILEELDARSTDREAGAVAHIAYQHDIPFLLVLTMSTQAGSDEEVPPSFSDLAARNAQNVVTALLQAPTIVAIPKETPKSGTTEQSTAFILRTLVCLLIFESFLI